MITVKTVREHGNEYGSAYDKKKGDEYAAPPLVAQGLKANGFVTYADGKAATDTLALHGVPTETAAAK